MNSHLEFDPSTDDVETVSEGFSDSAILAVPITVRSSPHSYLGAAFVFSYAAGFLFYVGYDPSGFVALFIALIAIPILYLTDKLAFDGRSIYRTGILPTWWSRFNRSRRRIRLHDINAVETQAIRAVRRGATVKYRYRTAFHGKGIMLAAASGSDSFRTLIQAVLPQLDDSILDIRSVELRDHLADTKEVLMKAEFARIPSSSSLESDIEKALSLPRKHATKKRHTLKDDETPEYLLALGNELRTAGFLARGYEAMRRSVVWRPDNAEGLLDLGKCMISIAAATKKGRIERRGLATLRLAGVRGNGDRYLLTRLGECYAQIGHWELAEKLFQRIADESIDTFRSARGRAEAALRSGKIAHVIHQYGAAERLAGNSAQRKWAKGEGDYYVNLNGDEEYMQTEVARVSSLENASRAMGTTLRLAMFSFPVIATGMIFDEPIVANVGWAVSAVSITIWCTLLVVTKFLTRRIPYDLFESERGE